MVKWVSEFLFVDGKEYVMAPCEIMISFLLLPTLLLTCVPKSVIQKLLNSNV